MHTHMVVGFMNSTKVMAIGERVADVSDEVGVDQSVCVYLTYVYIHIFMALGGRLADVSDGSVGMVCVYLCMCIYVYIYAHTCTCI
jgi:hypothetical protein